MKDLLNLPVARLKRIVELKTKIEKLHMQLDDLVIGGLPASLQKLPRKRRAMSAAVRRKMSEAAKARWAKIRAAK